MSLPTEVEIVAYQAARDAERDVEFAANPPEGSSGFTRSEWVRLTFGEQAYYRRGQPKPDYKPDAGALRAMSAALADTPAPSIASGYGAWAYNILELLHRRGFKLGRS